MSLKIAFILAKRADLGGRLGRWCVCVCVLRPVIVSCVCIIIVILFNCNIICKETN